MPAPELPTPAAAPKRAAIVAIINRYLKPGVPWIAAKEMPVFHRLWKAYPDEAFWTKHEVGFPLNSMCWFMTAEGKVHLEAAHRVFHFEYAPASVDKVESPVDYPHADISPPPVIAPARPRSVAEYLSSPNPPVRSTS